MKLVCASARKIRWKLKPPPRRASVSKWRKKKKSVCSLFYTPTKLQYYIDVCLHGPKAIICIRRHTLNWFSTQSAIFCCFFSSSFKGNKRETNSNQKVVLYKSSNVRQIYSFLSVCLQVVILNFILLCNNELTFELLLPKAWWSLIWN